MAGSGGEDGAPGDAEWLYHVPQFEDRLRDRGALRVSEVIDASLGGVVYHHRGARVPAHEATFVREDETFSLEVDAVGSRGAWAAFETDAAWDVFVAKRRDSTPYVAWLCDAEFDRDEAGRVADKRTAVALGRFSFGCYLHPPDTWAKHRRRASLSDAPCFLHRPDGRTVVPDATVDVEDDEYVAALPPELRGAAPPEHLGLRDAELDAD
jgi:hypothetical protein